jgi:UDP-N-acetylmuramate--alanine ligase
MQHRNFFFVGIGGSGMQPLSIIVRARGATVAGSDRGLDQGRNHPKFDALRAAGITLHRQDGSGVTSPDQIVVASAAVEESVPDIAAANRLGCLRMTRAELNAALFNAAALPIGVAGTSGKSTVTGMIGRILHGLGRDPTVMNGAAMKDFGGASAIVGSGPGAKGAYVSEVDESDGSIARYRPRIAVLNNVSLDHKGLDELRQLFGDFARKAEHVIANAGDAETAALLADLPNVTTFAVEGGADLRAENLSPQPFAISFDLLAGGLRHRVHLQVPGRHNVSNALAAIGAAQAAGVPIADAVAQVETFTGLRRRFDLVGEAAGVAVIDDFGHNPDKIAATLVTLHLHPGRLLVLFQPHGYGPLKQMGTELAQTFVDKLAPDDVLVMPDPAYFGGTVARDVGSGDIVARITAAGRKAYHDPDRDNAAARLTRMTRPGDRIIVMGARDDTLGTLAARIVADLH